MLINVVGGAASGIPSMLDVFWRILEVLWRQAWQMPWSVTVVFAAILFINVGLAGHDRASRGRPRARRMGVH